MVSSEEHESEQKYDVADSAPLPELPDIPGVERVADPVEDRMEAIYFDTGGLALAARRITLRRRTGGTDPGWHLKIPDGPDRNHEIHAPLGQPAVVPEDLVDHLLVHTRGEDILPIARLTTQRMTHRLYGPDGVHLADFVDDRVHAEAEHPAQGEGRWREWQIEPVHGTEDFFAAAAGTLTSTGASLTQYASKLARALGDAWPPEQLTGAGKPRRKGPASDVVIAYLAEQINTLLDQDPGVRLGKPDAVHSMRSATRRARSALATYRRLFDRGVVRRLRAELKWLARILDRPRDAEVMRERLRHQFQDQPADLVSGPAFRSIDRDLGTAYNAGYRKVLKALESGRFYRLLDDLEDFRDRPPATALASGPASTVTAKLANKAGKRLRRTHKTAMHSGNGRAHDTALHQVRKAAKRLRHAAESVTGIHGKNAIRLAKSARRIQKILGEHHDSVTARALLRRLGADPNLPARTAEAYSRLHDVEERIAEHAEAKYFKARKKAHGARLNN